MSQFNDQINEVREEVINAALLASLIYVFPALIFSISRYFDIGWHNIFLVHIGFALSILMLNLFRHKLSVSVKVHVFVSLFFIITVIGLLWFKVAGASYMIFVCISIATLLYGRKSGYFYFAIYLIAFAVIAYLHISSVIEVKLDFNQYLNNTLTWISHVVGYVFGVLVIIYSVSLFYNLFTHTIGTLEQKSKELHYSEERFRTFMEKYPYPISIKDVHQNYVYLNKATLELDGIKQKVSQNDKAEDLFPEDISEKINKADKYVIENDDFVNVDVVARLNNRNHYHTLIKFPLLGPEGEKLIGGITINNTEQKLAEQNLEISEHKYRSIFEGSIDGFIFLNEENRILECNQSICKLLGYQRAELIGKNMDLIVHPKCIDYENKLLGDRNLEDTGFSGIYEQVYQSATGKNISVELTINKLLLGGEKYYWVLVRDLTEKKMMDKKLFEVMVESEERERARYARELHDGLGPLLSTCKIYHHSYVNAQDKKTQEEFSVRTEELLDEALTSIKEISNNLSPEVLKKYGLTQSLVSFANRLKEVTSVEFIIDSDVNERLSEVVEITLYRTLVELINNSIKYSGASLITIDLKQTKELIRAIYKDNGVGFDYEQEKKASKGFGLLNLENRIGKIGGEFIYSTREGKGVNVYINLKSVEI